MEDRGRVKALSPLQPRNDNLTAEEKCAYYCYWHSVGGQTTNGRWFLSSSVVVCNLQAGGRAGRPSGAWPTLDGWPARLRPVRATPAIIIVAAVFVVVVIFIALFASDICVLQWQ